MVESEYGEFSRSLNAAMEIKGKPAPSDSVMEIWWRLLAKYELRAVTAAIDAHLASSPYVVTPDSVISIIDSHDGRPNAEEAWALVLKTTDEHDTVIWTTEMAKAWAIAQPVWDSKDKIGARMAFREHYERLISIARDNNVETVWRVSLGYDVEQRKEVVADAVSRGLIKSSQASSLLPDSRQDVKRIGSDSSGGVSAGLLKMRKMIADAEIASSEIKRQGKEAKRLALRDSIAGRKKVLAGQVDNLSEAREA